MRSKFFLAAALLVSPPAFAADTPQSVAQSIVMVDIKPGTFDMGLEPGNGSAFGYPKRKVTVPGFKMGAYEVTFDQYDSFARATKRALPDDEGWGRGDRPVINVNWDDIQSFIAWLNRSGRKFRLPSEAEWEYAASTGAPTAHWYGDQVKPEMANTNVNKDPDIYPFTAPVGKFPPNSFGLYDTEGNVWEWAQDCRGANYNNAPNDGSADLSQPCDARASRGGGWNSGASVGVRPQVRGAMGESFRSMAVGFRLAESK